MIEASVLYNIYFIISFLLKRTVKYSLQKAFTELFTAT